MTPQEPPSSPNMTELVQRLTTQRDLYSQLKTLSDQQADLIAQGATEQLLSVLSQRQTIVEQLGMINHRLAPLREQWPSLAQTLSAEQRQHINSLLEEVEQLLQSIVEQDDRDRAQLQSDKQKVAGELEHVNRAGRAVQGYGAYRAAAGSAARFTDRQG